MKKKKVKNSITPLLLGISGILGVVSIIAMGSLAIGGLVINDGQKQLLSLSEQTTVPYLRAAEIAAMDGDYALAEKLVSRSSVLGLNSDQEEIIRPEVRIKEEIKKLEEQAEKTPSAYLYLSLARDYYQVRDFDNARLSIQKAVKVAPNDTEVERFRSWSESW